jgi:hypothetical protein
LTGLDIYWKQSKESSWEFAFAIIWENPHMTSIPTLAQLAQQALTKQEFSNLEPEDPLHEDAFEGVATICLDGPTQKKYSIGAQSTRETELKLMQRTLCEWEKARNGFSLKDKNAPIYVIYRLGRQVILRVGFPRMGRLHGMIGPLGGHIDLAAKEPCLAAGQVQFTRPEEGFGVKAIDNQSGHYQPTETELEGKLLKTPKTITATVFRLALEVPDLEKIYSDPEDEQRKAQQLKEAQLQEKARNLTVASPAEDKLLVLCNEVERSGGLKQILTRNYTSEVQKLANIIARAKFGKGASQNSSRVQAAVREAFQQETSLKAAVLKVVSGTDFSSPLIRPEWIQANVK